MMTESIIEVYGDECRIEERIRERLAQFQNPKVRHLSSTTLDTGSEMWRNVILVIEHGDENE